MQNTYAETLIKNRTIYYACRSIAGQSVIKGQYEKLNRVVVSFIMTGKSNQHPVEIIKLRDEYNNVYSELLTLYNVYVPAVNERKDKTVSDSLILFSDFFAVKTKSDMKKFILEYSDDKLGKELIYRYSEAIKMNDLDSISRGEFFDMKITEQDINEAKIEALAEGRAEGKAEGLLLGMLGLVRDGILTISEAAKRAGMSVSEFEEKSAKLALQ